MRKNKARDVAIAILICLTIWAGMKAVELLIGNEIGTVAERQK